MQEEICKPKSTLHMVELGGGGGYGMTEVLGRGECVGPRADRSVNLP